MIEQACPLITSELIIYCDEPGLVDWPGDMSGWGVVEPGISPEEPLLPLLPVPEVDPALFEPGLLVSPMVPVGEEVVLPVPLVPELVPLPGMPAQAPSKRARLVNDVVHFIIEYSRKIKDSTHGLAYRVMHSDALCRSGLTDRSSQKIRAG